MFEAWVVWRYLSGGRRLGFFNLVSVLAIIGMALGVASLIVVMAVVSGFETTLRSSVVDVMGHLYVIRKGGPVESIQEIQEQVKTIVPKVVSMTPFVQLDAIVPFKGQITGVTIEGVDPVSVHKTLNLRPRVVKGVFDLGRGDEDIPPAMIGRGLSEKMQINVGDEISVALPRSSPTTKILGFTSRVRKFRVAGVIDLGMYKYDSRYILTSARAVQDLGGLGKNFLGLRIKIPNDGDAQKASSDLSSGLGFDYFSRDWYDTNTNLFTAIQIERYVIFIVMLFMTVAACFNISSTLYISVLRRYGDISIFKTMGASRWRLIRFFSLQGMVIGVIGCGLGLVVGFSVIYLLSHTDFIYVPPEIYNLRRLPVKVANFDVLLVVLASFILCFISTLAPASRGARFNPVEGLRYD